MLEKLLRRLAARNPPLPASPPSSASDSHLLSSAHASSSANDSVLRPFPARGYTAQADGLARELLSWEAATKSHFEACVDPVRPPLLPAVFDAFTGGHAALAQALWAQRSEQFPLLVHICDPHGLVAVLDQAQQRVWVRLGTNYSEPDELTWLEMPAQTMPPDGPDFAATTVHHLLWYYGQAVPLATQALPPDMGIVPLQMRRFPPVEPQVLEMRHLALLRVLSAGSMSFAQLQSRIHVADHHHLCADLASLYFTGALVLAPAAG